ncbi:CAR1 transcription factor-like [Procambarus clarkii]|uniref:CAR1 transcription factor-like n=1 Tax=Procambarus clarkii TaxID=6728 RepID=UPI0037428FBC
MTMMPLCPPILGKPAPQQPPFPPRTDSNRRKSPKRLNFQRDTSANNNNRQGRINRDRSRGGWRDSSRDKPGGNQTKNNRDRSRDNRGQCNRNGTGDHRGQNNRITLKDNRGNNSRDYPSWINNNNRDNRQGGNNNNIFFQKQKQGQKQQLDPGKQQQTQALEHRKPRPTGKRQRQRVERWRSEKLRKRQELRQKRGQLKQTVVSEVPLTEQERKLLEKGLTFVIGPPARKKREDAIEDLFNNLETSINQVWSKLRPEQGKSQGAIK